MPCNISEQLNIKSLLPDLNFSRILLALGSLSVLLSHFVTGTFFWKCLFFVFFQWVIIMAQQLLYLWQHNKTFGSWATVDTILLFVLESRYSRTPSLMVYYSVGVSGTGHT